MAPRRARAGAPPADRGTTGPRCCLSRLGPRREEHNLRCLSPTACPVALHHLEQVALAPDVVALAVQVLARRLALLLPELRLLLLDPAQLGDRERRGWCRGSCASGPRCAPARRGMDAEMDVLDVLQHHVHRDVAQLDLPTPSVFALRLDDQEDPLDLGHILQQSRTEPP